MRKKEKKKGKRFVKISIPILLLTFLLLSYIFFFPIFLSLSSPSVTFKHSEISFKVEEEKYIEPISSYSIKLSFSISSKERRKKEDLLSYSSIKISSFFFKKKGESKRYESLPLLKDREEYLSSSFFSLGYSEEGEGIIFTSYLPTSIKEDKYIFKLKLDYKRIIFRIY